MKAVILKHVDKGSFVLDRQGTVRLVKGYGSMPVGSEVKLRRRTRLDGLQIVAIAAFVMLSLSLGRFAWLWNIAENYIYVDINPSVELVFNRFDRLIEAKPLNQDASDLLEGLDLGNSPEQVVINLIHASGQGGYLPSDRSLPAVSIAVCTAEDGDSEAYVQAISQSLESNGLLDMVLVEECSSELQARANSLGITPGKLLLVERLLELDPSFDVDEALGLSVAELTQAIHEAEDALQPDGHEGLEGEEPGGPADGDDASPEGSEDPGGGGNPASPGSGDDPTGWLCPRELSP